MPAYTLQLNIDAADLGTIRGVGENIVIARAFSDSSSNVAWASFLPFGQNTVSWDNEYGMYAATTVSSGKIQPQSMSAMGIPSGMYYNFTTNATFSGPFAGESAPAAGSYRVFNQMPYAQFPTFVFGLTQSVTSNGIVAASRPATAETVPANQFATFTPLDSVYVWLQSGVVAGDIVKVPPQLTTISTGDLAVSSRSTTVQFNGPSTLSYAYSATAGGFLPSA